MSFINAQLTADLPSGKRTCRIVGKDISEPERDGVELTACIDGMDPIQVFSGRSVFDALKQIRLKLEEVGGLLLCFGSDEAVYPSPMQEAMGLNTLAYRQRLGNQARTEDIVDIFDWDESVRATSVSSQEEFHQVWLKSL